jgi:hypothetical protein
VARDGNLPPSLITNGVLFGAGVPLNIKTEIVP